ncbi:unnamed protein product [Malus baccata var. baccata]
MLLLSGFPSQSFLLTVKFSFVLQKLGLNGVHSIQNLCFFYCKRFHAALPLPPEPYWNSVLPNRPMPKTISELIQPDESSMFGYNSDESSMFGYNSDESSMFGYKEDVGEIANTYKDASENLTHEDPTRALFFLETDIHPGKTMNYQ